jgi:hypothetical protein
MKKSELKQLIREELENESSKNKIIKIFGVNINPDGTITVTNRIGKVLAKMAVMDGYMEKVDDKTYKLKK